jgi:serine/threonine protein kinase
MTKAKLSPLPPNTVLSGYAIVRQVSEGGFSLVYLARDPQNQQLAIKEYLPSSLASRSEGQLALASTPR